MATINSIAGQQSLSLGNEEYLRKFAFGTNWQYLRLAIHFGINMSATLNTPLLTIGVNSGTQFGFKSPNCVEFLGLTWTNAGGQGFTFVSGTPNYFSGAMNRFHYKVGNTDTLSQNNATGALGPITPTRGFFLLDIIKHYNTGAFDMAYFYALAAVTVQTDLTIDAALRIMDRDNQPPSNPGNGGFGANIYTGYTGPYSFDSFSISWNDNVNTCDISSIIVSRYY